MTITAPPFDPTASGPTAARPAEPRSLFALADALSAQDLIDAARAIDAGRTPEREAALMRHHGLRVPGLVETPFEYQAALRARERGFFAFDRLERAFLPPAPGWIHHDLRPDHFAIRLDVDRLAAPKMWPFSQDAPVADFEVTAAPRWWSHGLVHAMIGFAWWPGLREWAVMHMARLGEAVAALHWYWLGELGREYCPQHTIATTDGVPNCPECQRLARRTHSAEARAERLADPKLLEVAQNAVDVLRYELHCYRHGLETNTLEIPSSDYLTIGESCDYALYHHRRLTSPSFQRWLEHCMAPGEDYATGPVAFSARCARVLDALLTPAAEPEPDEAVAGRRAVRVLQDIGWRLCHAAALREQATTGFEAGLRAVGEAIDRLRDGADEPEAVLEQALAVAVAELEATEGAPGAAEVLAVGYRPTLDPAREPAAMLAARVGAYRRRVGAAGSPLRLVIDALDPVAERVVRGPRQANLAADYNEAVEAAGEVGEITVEQQTAAAWFFVAAQGWGPDRARELLPLAWYYRLSTRTLPERARWHEYQLRPNPYLSGLGFPFRIDWLEALFASDGATLRERKPAVATSAMHALVGPGRHGPRVLPLTEHRQRLLARTAGWPTVAEVLAEGPTTEDELQAALREELLICLGI